MCLLPLFFSEGTKKRICLKSKNSRFFRARWQGVGVWVGSHARGFGCRRSPRRAWGVAVVAAGQGVGFSGNPQNKPVALRFMGFTHTQGKKATAAVFQKSEARISKKFFYSARLLPMILTTFRDVLMCFIMLFVFFKNF